MARLTSVFDCMNPQHRNTQEDAHNTYSPLIEYPGHRFTVYQLFDGHGGRGTVDFVSHALACNILQFLERPDSQNDIARVLRSAFLLTDIQCRSYVKDASGATAISCVLHSQLPTPEDERTYHRLYCANAGDSRVVLCQNGSALRLSYDHKPEDWMEQQRIAKLGGFSMRKRVLGVLAVSRSFGDQAFKKFVTAEPHIFVVDITEKDQFMILGCDGVFDVMSDEETVALVKEISTSKNNSELDAAKIIAREAVRRGSTDNVTAMVVYF